MAVGDNFKQSCFNCGGRNHTILAENIIESEQDDDYFYFCSYQIVQCAGCDFRSFRKELISEDDYELVDPETGATAPIIERFPKLNKWTMPDWAVDIDIKGMFRILKELYCALDNELYTLSAMGIRKVIDLICSDKLGADAGPFEQKLESLEKNNIISSSEKKLLEFLVELGNAASHRAFNPNQKMLQSAEEIMKHLILKHYIYPAQAEELVETAIALKEKVPPKPRFDKSILKKGSKSAMITKSKASKEI